MNIRTSSCVASSLNAAAFRTVLARDRRGLVYRLRREVMTLRRLREDPLPPVRTPVPHGRIRTSRDIKTMPAGWGKA
jgi:hypothetical protein